jgi:hypothetical protein
MSETEPGWLFCMKKNEIVRKEKGEGVEDEV